VKEMTEARQLWCMYFDDEGVRKMKLMDHHIDRGMSVGTVKDEIRKMLDEIPDDASLEDIQYHIYVRQKIKRGLKDAKDGRTMSQEEVEKRMSKWLEE
jgi:hypothetical protein